MLQNQTDHLSQRIDITIKTRTLMFKNMNVNEEINKKFLPSSVYLKDCLSLSVYCYHGALVFFLLLLTNSIMLISNALADGNIGIMFQDEENQLYQRQFDG